MIENKENYSREVNIAWDEYNKAIAVNFFTNTNGILENVGVRWFRDWNDQTDDQRLSIDLDIINWVSNGIYP